MPLPPFGSGTGAGSSIPPPPTASSAASRAPARRTLKKFSSVSNLDSAAARLSAAPNGSSNNAPALPPPVPTHTIRSSPSKPSLAPRPAPTSYLQSSSASHVNPRVRSVARSKSNIDLAAASGAGAARVGTAGTTARAASRRSSAAVENNSIEVLLRRGPGSTSLKDALQELRYLVLTEGIKSDKDGHSPIRVYVWSILLGVAPMRSADYLALVRRGPSAAYAKIRNDTFRTLATDILFRRNVTEASLIRLLNAHAWSLKDSHHNSALYVQGMNVIAAPFLYASKSEVEAFCLFSRFVRKECPGYVRPTMEGVHKGLTLVDECLATVDPKLFAHLKAKLLSAKLYAFPSILTLSACTPPLNEVLPLWDFLIAYGAHLNVLCVVAQLLLMRDTLLSAPSPVKHLRTFPPLRSKEIISVAVSLIRRIPQDLYTRVVEHAK